MPETPRGPRPDPNPASGETLNLDLDHNAVYGRIFMSTKVDVSKIAFILNPEKTLKLPINLASEAFLDEERNYDPVVWGLSKHERKQAWKDIISDQGFEHAYSLWSGSVLGSFIQTTDEKRKAVISHFTKKDTGFDQGDIDKLYYKYCNGRSNINEFVTEALKDSSLNFSDVEWLAQNLFGKDSGTVVTRIMEVESSMSTDAPKAFNAIFVGQDKLDRINAPTDGYEKDILGKLSGNFEWPPTGVVTRPRPAQGPSGPGAPTTESTPPEPTPETEDENQPMPARSDIDRVKNPPVPWDTALIYARTKGFNAKLFEEGSSLSTLAQGLMDKTVDPESISDADREALTELQKATFKAAFDYL